MIKFSDVTDAQERIKTYIRQTPLEYAMTLSDDNRKIFLKLECQQLLKAFKIRGAFNKLLSLSQQERREGIAAISSGNHGAAVSYAANVLGIRSAKIFVPKTIPQSKLAKIRYYGAEVILIGDNYDEAHFYGKEAIQKEGLLLVDSCSDREVIAGQGTIGMEILAENPNIDIILVPIGISVAVKKLKPTIQVIGVQPEVCPAMLRAMEDGVFYEEYPTGGSMCDALAGGVAEIPFLMASKCIDSVLLASEEGIFSAARTLLTEEKIVSEPSGAVGVAVLQENSDLFAGKEIAAVISGGNLDRALMKRLLW